jgi:Flp pilus assembly protein TadB
MSLDLTLLVVFTLVGLLAVVVLAGSDPIPTSARPVDADVVRRLLTSVGAAAIVLAFSGWVIASVVVGVGCWFAVRVWQRRDRRAVSDVERTDALASWIENLRDVLVAGDQPVGAINATVATCPAPIKPQVRRLAAGLGRQDPAIVLRRFADDLDDPLGDLVAAGLLIAVQRGARTAAVLSALADQARRQADRRRLVEAERAPVQREVTLLTVIMGSLIVGLLVFGRAEYLDAYDTPGGQLFLALVLGIYALLLVRVQQLAHLPRPSRFLTADTHIASGAILTERGVQ